MRVSVPCRGTTFLNKTENRSWNCYRKLFPSPVGELHFSILGIFFVAIGLAVSVPCRGTTFLNIQRYKQLKDITSFRPLSGNYISQLSKHFASQSDVQASFRPLSGNYISQSTIYNFPKQKTLFPSPVGELHFSIPSLQSRHQSGLMVEIAWEKYFWKNK